MGCYDLLADADTDEAGLDRLGLTPSSLRGIPGNFSGAGVSAGDLNGDGYLDLVVGDGERSRLLLNDGDWKFVDVAPGWWSS